MTPELGDHLLLLSPHLSQHHELQQAAGTSSNGLGVLSRRQVEFVHYYAKHLGRWLDCTDASRQLTLEIPRLVRSSPILLQAVISFAARHANDPETAQAAHERCVEMLIVALDSAQVQHDEALLCAIVILRVFEQLNGELHQPLRSR